MKKELVYTMPCETEQEIQQAEDLRFKLYETHNNVQVYPHGCYEVRIVAAEEI